MITSRQNARLKDIRRLRRCKDDRALLEGPHLIAEALAAGLDLESVLAAPDTLEKPPGQGLATTAAERGIEILEVAPRLLEEIADADSPRGLLAVARLPRPDIEGIPIEDGAVYVYAEGIQDPGNLGALARSAEAAGARALLLSPGTVHPNHPRALRASAGSLLRLPTAVAVDPEAAETRLAAAALRWITLQTKGGVNLFDSDLEGTLLLALGGEGSGLSSGLSARAELAITISLAEPVESLNATVAASLVLFEIRRRRRSVAPGEGMS